MQHTTTDLLTRIESLEDELGRLKSLAAQQSPAAGSPVTRDDPAPGEPSTSRRDWLRFGGVAALGAAAAAMTTSPAEAADGGPVLIGNANAGTSNTTLAATGAWGFWTTSNSSYGLIGQSIGIGTYGSTSSASSSGAGVQGISGSGSGAAPGVYGYSNSPNAPAVYGYNSVGGNAMRAEVPAAASANAIAMYALNYSTYAGATPGAGGFAIYGLSAKGHGLVGATASAGAAAVVGATNGVAGAYAAALYGPVIVGGDFTVVGGAKSAAVPHPDGSHRRLYCVESPESWFEDFGRGRLVCGEANLLFDPDFAAVVDTSDYHVFLTGDDDLFNLSVSNRTADGFRVKGAPGVNEGTFSWRVVAKRKDIPGPRFEKVEIPTEPKLPPIPASATEDTPPEILKLHEKRG